MSADDNRQAPLQNDLELHCSVPQGSSKLAAASPPFSGFRELHQREISQVKVSLQRGENIQDEILAASSARHMKPAIFPPPSTLS